MAFRVTDADVVRPCTIGNRAVASRGSSRLSPRRKRKEPLSRRVNKIWLFPLFCRIQIECVQCHAIKNKIKNRALDKVKNLRYCKRQIKKTDSQV